MIVRLATVTSAHVCCIDALNGLEQVLVLEDAIADFSPRPIDLIQLIYVVLISTQCLVVDIFNTSIIGGEDCLGVGKLGLVQAQKLLPIVHIVQI